MQTMTAVLMVSKGCLFFLVLVGPARAETLSPATALSAASHAPSGSRSMASRRMSPGLVIEAETSRSTSDEAGARAGSEAEPTDEDELEGAGARPAGLIVLLSFLVLIFGLLFRWSSDRSHQSERSVFAS